MRSAMFGLAFLVAASSAHSGPAADPYADVDSMGWLRASDNEFGAMYLRSAPPVGDRRRVWLRIEYPRPTGGFMSVVMLDEFDCALGRYRFVQSTGYPARNMQGQSRPGSASSDWTYVVPGSMAEYTRDAACGTSPPS